MKRSVCGGASRTGEVRLVWSVAQEHGQGDAAANFAATVMDTLTNMNFEVVKIQSGLVQTIQQGR